MYDPRTREFQIGDIVTWVSDGRDADDFIARYGEGPFRVVGLRLHHSDVISTGQFPVAVTIDTKQSPLERQEFDGGWFRKVG